jgi:diguanylate cyclase (GGDEF)-like protein
MDINTTSDDRNLLERQLLPLFESTRSGSLANIFAVWLVYALVNNTHHQTNAMKLGIAVSVLSLIRILMSDTYLRTQGKKIHFHLKSQIILIFIIGVTWGLFSLMLSSFEDQSVRDMVYLVNFGMIAGSLATLSVWVPAYTAYVLPQAVCIFSVLAMQGTSISLYMAAAFSIFIAIMVSISLRVNRSHKHEVILNFKNKKLINDLNSEVLHRKQTQEKLEDSKHYLEEKVEERTKELSDINRNLEKVIEKKELAEKNLEYLAYHDELTGLPNRTLLINRIEHAIDSAKRAAKQIGIIFLDIDRFKAINDSLGHTVGDKLIQEVSKRLSSTLRKEDTISRNGGDEFVVVIQRLNSVNEAVLVAQKLIDSMTDIFVIDSHKIHIGASIGISVYPDDGDSALELLRDADTAMFSAKKAGGNRLQFYDESMSNKLRARLVIENELHYALERNEFFMMYQPQVNCLTGETIGFEALLRWNCTALGLIGPHQFIPILEETGLIYSVGEWVIKEVINFIYSGHAGNARIAVNLSALQFGDTNLIKVIGDELSRTGIDPSKIEFEITESLLINDFETTEKFLMELHSLGCFIALDDFGTGYTSMSYLTRLPIDSIKVDQCFVRDIDTNIGLENIVKAIVNMSKSLGMGNVFEGVETKAELEVIKKLDGVVIQGYLFSKPLDLEATKEWLLLEKVTEGKSIKLL